MKEKVNVYKLYEKFGNMMLNRGNDENQIKLFIFSNKKAVDLMIPEYFKNSEKEWTLIMTYLLTCFSRRGLFVQDISNLKEVNSVIFSKVRFKKREITDKDYDLKAGLHYSIPKCCVEKYCEENGEKQSYNSAKRYLEQCKDMKIKEDLFEINLNHNGASCEKFGFVPCSPKCKNALKIVKNLEEINKRLERLKWIRKDK